MARTSVQAPLPVMEVNKVRQVTPEANDVRRLPDKALAMAKMRAGAAVQRAVEGRSLKEFGSKSRVSEVCSGEKVPEFLARIVQDGAAKRKFALALLEDDTDIVIATTYTITHRKAG